MRAIARAGKKLGCRPNICLSCAAPRIGKDISRQNRQIENEEHKPEQQSQSADHHPDTGNAREDGDAGSVVAPRLDRLMRHVKIAPD